MEPDGGHRRQQYRAAAPYNAGRFLLGCDSGEQVYGGNSNVQPADDGTESCRRTDGGLRSISVVHLAARDVARIISNGQYGGVPEWTTHGLGSPDRLDKLPHRLVPESLGLGPSYRQQL